MRVTPRWGSISAWTTLYDAALTTDALRIPTPYVARVAAGSDLNLQHRAFSVSVHARTMGRRPFSAGPRDFAYELPAVTLIDVGIAHPLPRLFTPRNAESLVSWSIDNVGDAAWQSVRGFPSPGRSFAITLTLRHTPAP